MMNFPTISVVVPCYNVEHIVGKCIIALLNQEYPKEKFTIIIVDDKSTDGTVKIIESFRKDKQVKIIKHYKNRGLSATRNSGIRAAQSQLVGFLDSDIVVNADWIKKMLSAFENPDVIACMGDTKMPDEFPMDALDKFLYHPGRGVRKYSQSKPIEVPGFIMGNSLVLRKAINEVGMFNEAFNTWGGEDTDLAIRLWMKYPKGLRFVSEAVGSHYHKRELKNLLQSIEKYGSTNYLLLLERYPQYSKRLAGDWINSFKGRLLMNPLVNFIVKLIYLIIPLPRLIRYFIAYSVIRGARNPAKDIPKLANNKGVT